MSEFAQAWADDLSSRGAFEHNEASEEKGYGENISGMWSSANGKIVIF